MNNYLMLTLSAGGWRRVINGESHYGYLLKKNNNNLQPIYNQQVYYSWDQIGILSHKSIQLWTKSLTTAFHTTSTIKHS